MLIFGSSAERNYQSGMEGMVIGRVLLFISFEFQDAGYACALVHWLVPMGVGPDEDTGMWVVCTEYDRPLRRSLAVIPVGHSSRSSPFASVWICVASGEFPFLAVFECISLVLC